MHHTGPHSKDLPYGEALTIHRLKALLKHAPYPALRHVSVDYRGGVALLWGELPSFYLKQVAQTVVASVDGVKMVDNRIEVNHRPSPSAEC